MLLLSLQSLGNSQAQSELHEQIQSHTTSNVRNHADLTQVEEFYENYYSETDEKNWKFNFSA